MSSYMNLLTISGKLGFTAPPAPPPYTKMERAYLSKTMPGIKEAKPKRNEKSALWLDWAAAKELGILTSKMKNSKTATETKKAKSSLIPGPEYAHIKEAIRLWTLATAAENGSPAPKISKKRLDMESALVNRIIAEKYKRASVKEIRNCRFDDFVADIIGKAAKRLLIAPVKSSKNEKQEKPITIKLLRKN